MARYLVFGGNIHKKQGGIDDLVANEASLENAQAAADAQLFRARKGHPYWAHIAKADSKGLTLVCRNGLINIPLVIDERGQQVADPSGHPYYGGQKKYIWQAVAQDEDKAE